MSYILNSRERQALDRMQLNSSNFHIKAELGTGIGAKTVESLLALGLIEPGANVRHYGQIGWRLTDDGWRCMYGKTLSEMGPGTGPHRHLRVWSWPPMTDGQK
jgi:hypothetical protein